MGAVFKPLLLANSVSLILVHNHPAGIMKPSQADQALTAKIGEIAKLLDIYLMDHIILNADGSDFFSFKKMGLMKD
jgi:DNA repair protein RadC